MISYLMRHTTSVFVTLAVLFVLGILSYCHIPTSLLPNISVPKISVHVVSPQENAEQIETKIIAPLRMQLQQVDHLKELHSLTENDEGVINLTFNYGTDMGLSFIVVNEVVDDFMGGQTNEFQRPLVTKENISDIPVCRFMVVPKNNFDGDAYLYEIAELSENCQTIIKQRLEQLNEVSSAEISGAIENKFVVTLNGDVVKDLGIDIQVMMNILNDYNKDDGQFILKEGTSEYYLTISTGIKSIDDLKNVQFLWGERIIKLGDISTIENVIDNDADEVYYNGCRAISFELVKAPDTRMADFNRNLQEIKKELEEVYPQYEFHILNDQSKLLESTINGLFADLIISLFVVLLASSFFYGSLRLSSVVFLCIIVSLSISFGILYLLGFSINMFSLVGLILSTGLMIDNALIVTDNITQNGRDRFSIEDSCVRGTREVMGPMLSSTLTTIVVFCPLLFLGEIAGELFYEQSISVAVCLSVSYVVAVVALPVIYKFIMRNHFPILIPKHRFLFGFYDAGIHFVFRHSKSVAVVSLLTIPLCFWLFQEVEKEGMPTTETSEFKIHVEWNEVVSNQESHKRIIQMVGTMGEYINEYATFVGNQRYANQGFGGSLDKCADIYIKLAKAEDMEVVVAKCGTFLEKKYPIATYSINPPESVMETLFPSTSADMTLKLYPYQSLNSYSESHICSLSKKLSEKTGSHIETMPFLECINLQFDHQQMVANGIRQEDVLNYLRTALENGKFEMEDHFDGALEEGGNNDNLENILNTRISDLTSPLCGMVINTFVKNDTFSVPKRIEADSKGSYIPLTLKHPQDIEQAESAVREFMSEETGFDYQLDSAVYEYNSYIRNLVVILLVSVLLMYLIMVAQFESFIQPLLILLEIPINIFIALIVLPVSGMSLNIMSVVGLIISCGIVVNDSILKIDVINDLRKQGLPLKEAIHQAGTKRLRSIMMTAMTSILAILPILFSQDVSAEIQKPFAVTMLVTLFSGVFVSLFTIPLFYWIVYKNKSLS